MSLVSMSRSSATNLSTTTTPAPASSVPRLKLKTLLVDCYPPDWSGKLAGYVRLLEPFTAVLTVSMDRIGECREPVSAVVLSGSPVMLTSTPPPSKLAAFLSGLTVPVFGICFGHQLLGIAAGAVAARREFYEAPGLVRVCEPEPLFAGLNSPLVVFESHAEHLDPGSVIAAGFEILADSRLCPVEAMRHLERPWYGVQFHPELSGTTGIAVLENFYRRVVAETDPA